MADFELLPLGAFLVGVHHKRRAPVDFIAGLRDLDVAFPRIRTAADLDHQIAGTRGLGFPVQAHTRFAGEPVSFTVIARETRARRIRPRIFPAARHGHNVIHRQIAASQGFALYYLTHRYPAVDAGVFVAHQDTLAAPMGVAAWHIDITPERNDRWNREFVAHSPQETIRIFNDDGFAGQE